MKDQPLTRGEVSQALLAILSVGFPFCGFKLLLGQVCLRALPSPGGTAIGVALLVLCGVDLIFNLLNLAWLLLARSFLLDECLLTFVFRRGNRELGTAIDVLLSCALVAVMVGGNLFGYLTSTESTLWTISVVVNVLGAGLSRVRGSLLVR